MVNMAPVNALGLVAAAVLALVPAAWAGPDYTSQQIIERFTANHPPGSQA